MEENSFFNQALHSFTTDIASGAAIRHLAELGYTAEEIEKKLTYPTPLNTIKSVYTKYLLKEGILAIEKPNEKSKNKYEYIREQNSYGKSSFRKVLVANSEQEKKEYIECHFTQSGKLRKELTQILSPKQISYLNSIDWSMGIRYHILNEMMKEIMNRILQ